MGVTAVCGGRYWHLVSGAKDTITCNAQAAPEHAQRRIIWYQMSTVPTGRVCSRSEAVNLGHTKRCTTRPVGFHHT